MSPVVSGTDGQRNSQSLPPRAIGSCTFFSRAIPLAGKIGLAHLDQSLHTNVGYLKSPKRRGTRVLLCDSIPSGTNCWKQCLPQITSEVPNCLSGCWTIWANQPTTPNGQELNGSECLLGAHRVGPRMDPHGR